MNGKERSSAKRIAAYGMAAVFAAVGIVFLTAPGGVIAFFNVLSGPLGMRPAPVFGASLYSALAAAYMYLVTILAWNTARRPKEDVFPRLLAHAKLASALVSFGLFAVCRPYLILLANGVIDGSIAAVLHFWFRRSGSAPRTSSGRLEE
jgi:hypothetical protein